MELKRMRRRCTPDTFSADDFQDFRLPTGILNANELSATASYLSSKPNETAIQEESIMRYFKESFDINIKTCTQEEWAERITFNGGTLKQWQSIFSVKKDQDMSTAKASLIFILLSIVLITGIGLLPKSISAPAPVPAITTTATAP